jgi:large subunit ribosomal protein L25
MAQKITFKTQPRTISGKKVSQLRRQGLVPANISGNVEKTVPVVVDGVKFEHLYNQVGDTGLFYLTVEGESKERPALVSEVQREPVSGVPIHVVFRQVNLSEKITAEVPVEVVGEFEVKGAILATLHDIVVVEALPQDFPEKFEIDATQLTEVGQMVTYKDLKFDASKVKLMIDEEQMDEPVVMVQEVKEEVEPEPTAVEGAAEGAEGAAPAEGEAAPAAEEKAAE